MAAPIVSCSRSTRFSFDATGCLYRGFSGERVLLDCEGGGTVFVHPGDIQLAITTVRKTTDPQRFPTIFQDSLVISSIEPGLFEAEVLVCAPEGLEHAEGQKYPGKFEGAGWLVGGQGRCQVDGKHEWVELAKPIQPVPVFVSAEGSGELSIVPDTETRCVLADAWDVSDAAGLKE